MLQIDMRGPSFGWFAGKIIKGGFLFGLAFVFSGWTELEAQQPAGSPKTPAFALENYDVRVLPANIAPTPLTQPKPGIKVYGSPRESAGHPCTLLDKEDVRALKVAITSNAEAVKAFDRLKKAADLRITQPLDVPAARKGGDGKWMFPGEFPEFAGSKYYRIAGDNAVAMADLGTMYQLSGNPDYGNYCKKMLLTYAENFNNYGHPPFLGKPWTTRAYRSAYDGRITGQFLEDGFWLCRAAYAYDMIYELPSWTEEERTKMREGLFEPMSEIFWDPAMGQPDYISQAHNRSVMVAAGVLMAGYATEDPKLITTALYGVGGTREQSKGGILQVHFSDSCLLPDGLWVEGSPAYQVGIAAGGLFDIAETLWHHGIDMYSRNDGALKRFLDAAIALAYPGPELYVAALHDSGRFGLLDKRDWLSNEVGVPYACGYRRYQDPTYIPLVRNASKSLSMTVHAGPVSLFYDLPDDGSVPVRALENVNFYSVGFGVLRAPTPSGGNQLIMEFGPSGSHAHPSKLALDVYALGEQVMPMPGVIFPYQDPLNAKWYQITMSNNALVIDGQSQIYAGSRWKFPRELPDPDATQLVFAPGNILGMQRAWSNTVNPGVIQDRSVFLTPEYMVDIFGAFSNAPHTYDLAWHFRGTMTTTLPVEPFKFPDPIQPGYNAINDLKQARSTEPWVATTVLPNQKMVRFLAPGGIPTQVFTGTGHYFTESAKNDENPATFFLRREGQNHVLFANAIDLSGDKEGFVKGITQEGSLEAGYGLLKLETAKGMDLCFTAFRPGSHEMGDFATDGMQAFVRGSGESTSGMYLAGGKFLRRGAVELSRSEPGLAYVEKTASGSYIVGNPSPTAAVFTVILAPLKGLKMFPLDERGQRAGESPLKPDQAGKIILELKANSRAELSSF